MRFALPLLSRTLAICAALLLATACSPDPDAAEDAGLPSLDAGLLLLDAGLPSDDAGVPAPACDNLTLDGDETDVDCGGGCPKCAAGKNCAVGQDCVTGTCASGKCVGCVTPEDCAGEDTECRVRTCEQGTCGFEDTAAGTALAAQQAGDCRTVRCDGNGGTIDAADDLDLPVDGNACTDDVCADGVASNPPLMGTGCGVGLVCDGSGACVQCLSAATCTGAVNECQLNTCIGGTCGVDFVAEGTATTSQTGGDCRQNQCDGQGNIVSAPLDTDLPDDNNACTDDLCDAGQSSHAPVIAGTDCGTSQVCDGEGSCVGCVDASDCGGSDTDCQTPTCVAGVCGLSFEPEGTATSGQTTGDCLEIQCDGEGDTVTVPSDSDFPADDGNECTSDICLTGNVLHPNVTDGTACDQDGGTTCVSGFCVAPPHVVGTVPADGSPAHASTSIAVTFDTAMAAATLTGQTAAGACSGAIHVSLDDFASCIGFSSATAALSAGGTVATLVPAPGLLVNRSYKIRVTTAATAANGFALSTAFTQASGFTTTTPLACDSSGVVISQVYGGGGNSGAPYKNDFIELHNRGSTAVSLAGMSVQHTSATGTGAWSVTTLTGTIQPGAYYLVQEGGGSTGSALPTPDATGTISMGANSGKVALVSSTTALSGGCPTGASIVDLVGFGTGATCFEGAAAAPAPSNSTSISRSLTCRDEGQNGADFAAGAVVPRNSASAAFSCGCARNETGDALEADYCDTQHPLSLSLQAGASSGIVYGQIYESGTTEAAGAASNVKAQLGYGPATVNPEYQPGWTWTDATYNIQANANDEYQASFTAPAAGTYRYAYRFSLDGGASWTYCDNAQTDQGAGANPSLAFDFENLAVMTVAP